MSRGIFVVALMLAFACLGIVEAGAAEAWQRWVHHASDSARTVDHEPWSQVLSGVSRQARDGVIRVDYSMLIRGRPARSVVDAYLRYLQSVKISQFNRNEQLAFWINLYNALTLWVVAEHYPIDSIQDIDISPGWFSSGPWGAELVVVEGERLTLDDIEHRILRPIWRDPRVHYAVNCASIGCPNLQPVAYTGANVDRLLTQGAIAYVNHPRGVSFDGSTLTCSKIYYWFDEDFGGSERGVIAHLLRYAAPELRQKLAKRASIDYYVYDWALNDLR